MRRVHKLLLSIAALLIVPVDAWVVAESLLSQRSDPINGWEIAIAVLVQGLAIAMGIAYAMYVAQAKPVDTRPNVILDALKLRLVPLLVAGILMALSVTLLEQAIKCGSHPFPTVRGKLLCGKP
jgi:hypothetical protein